MVTVAADLQPSRCVIAAVRRDQTGATILCAASFPNDESLPDRLRAFRRAWDLPATLRLVHWPRRGDAGVVHPSQRLDGLVRMPTPSLVRDRARPVVRSGFRISTVTLPHRVLCALARRIGMPDRVALLLERRGGCVALTGDDHQGHAAYFWWPASEHRDDDTAMALTRYQWAAQLAPHVTVMIKRAAPAAHAFACGGLPELRAAVVPLVQETDHEIDVLDETFPPGVGLNAAVREDVTPAAFLLAVTLASG